MDWQSFLFGLIVGGGGVKIAELLIAWNREKREQRSHKTSQEKDRPRFRVDVSIVPTSHSGVSAAVVKVLSLGSLPLRIDKGEAFFEASHYPERVQTQQFPGREISSIHPIELRFSLPPKLIHPEGVGEVTVKLICQFSYGENRRYRSEHKYNRNQFELVGEDY